MAKNDKTVKRGVYLYLDGKEIKNDINSIDLEMKRLQRDIKDMTRGSEEYNRTMAKIQHLQGILKQHRQELKGITAETKKATISIGSMVDWFNRFGGVILSAIGFLTGFTLALRSIRDERNKLEESQAGLKALTGLDDDNIAWLTEQAKTLSTTMTKEGLRVRQSAAEILDAFMLVGSAKPELLGDKEALKAVTEEAMRLQAAAKDIKLNEAVDALTLSLNQYGVSANQASRFVNVLAAGSKEGAANIASQAAAIKKAGTIAASSNIPIEELVGTIEMLGEKGVKDEVAGTGLKTFFTRLATGAADTNPKVVGLATALENLNKKVAAAEAKTAGGGTSLLKNLFGDEGMQTAMILSQNTEQVKKYTSAVTDTNVAIEQSAINSDTAAAKLAQARNNMKLAAIDLAEKLNPALTVSTNMVTNVVKYLPGLIDWFKKWGTTISMILVPVAAYIGYLKAAAMYQTALNKVTKIAGTGKVIYAAAVANLSGNLTGANKILTMFNASLIKNKTAVALVTASTYLLAAAKAALTGNLQKARVAMAAFNAVCTKNVYVSIATAIAAIGVALYKLATHTTEAQKAAREYQKQLYTERAELQKLTEAAKRAGEGTQQRKDLIDEINRKYGKYLTNLLDEHATLEDIKKAYQDINVAMQANIAQKVLDEKMEDISRDMLDKKVDKMNDIRKVLSKMLPTGQVNVITQRIDEVTRKYADAGKSAEHISKSLDYGLRNTFLKGAYVPGELEKGIKSYAKTVIKEARRIKKVKDELAAFVPGIGQKNELPEVTVIGKAVKKESTGSSESEEERKKRVNTELERMEAEHLKKLAELKRKYIADDAMTQSEYDHQVQNMELQHLNDKLAIIGMEPAERQKIEDQILNIQMKLKDKRLELKNQETKEYLSAQEKSFKIEFENIAKDYKKHLISHEEFLRKIQELQEKYGKNMKELYPVVTKEQKQELEKYLRILQEVIDKYHEMEEEPKKWNETVRQNWESMSKYTNASMDDMSAIVASLTMELIKLSIDGTESFETLEEKAEATFTLLSSMGKQFGVAVGELLSGEENAIGEFLKDTLDMVLTAIEQLMIAYIAQTTMRNIANLGFMGILKAAGEIALITAAFETAKATIGNFYTGGYTPSGSWDQPQGIVHSNEFVANRFAVANPNLRPIFDVIDMAQRTGNVGNLTAGDIAAVAGSHRTITASPTGAGASSAATTTNDPATLAVMKECIRVMRRLKVRLDEPLVAETYVTGKRGVNQAQRDYKRLEDNKSRNKK